MNTLSPEAIVILAGGTQLLGYLVINQVWLRLLLLLGTVFYMWYYMVVSETPLWEAFWLSALMGIANILGLIGLFMRRSRLAIPGEHRDIYPRFSELPPGDFRALMKTATRRIVTKREQLTKEGQPLWRLSYVISGDLRVHKAGEQFRLPPGVFVGEVAFMERKASAASTWLEPGGEVVQWDAEALRALADKNSRFRLALDAIIYRDLAAKVSQAVAPYGSKWRDMEAASSPASPFLPPTSSTDSSIR
jgi:hypothetical protein